MPSQPPRRPASALSAPSLAPLRQQPVLPRLRTEAAGGAGWGSPWKTRERRAGPTCCFMVRPP
eukprot:1773136-Alexandrium_andersonii.AAC.1